MERKNAVKRKMRQPSTKRGQDTRKRLKDAATIVLERQGYRNLRLQDVSDQAGVNFSLFYHYFSSKAELTHEILTEFIENALHRAHGKIVRTSPYMMIYTSNLEISQLYCNSPGLMRCLLHFDEEENRFSDIFRKASLDWNTRIATNLSKNFPSVSPDRSTLLSVAYVLGGMVDSFLFDRFVDKNPVLVKAFPDPQSAAEFVSIMWYRAVYMKNPPIEELGDFLYME